MCIQTRSQHVHCHELLAVWKRRNGVIFRQCARFWLTAKRKLNNGALGCRGGRKSYTDDWCGGKIWERDRPAQSCSVPSHPWNQISSDSSLSTFLQVLHNRGQPKIHLGIHPVSSKLMTLPFNSHLQAVRRFLLTNEMTGKWLLVCSNQTCLSI